MIINGVSATAASIVFGNVVQTTHPGPIPTPPGFWDFDAGYVNVVLANGATVGTGSGTYT